MIGSGVLEVNNMLNKGGGGCPSPETGGTGFYSGCDISLLYAGIIALIISDVALIVFSIRPEIIRAFPSRVVT
ncbi:hypothetical protein Ngar_c06570 [Candidatus Nitrososphaera gargensis Ga9.2]|uniref:Uncharacterized protein n=2 Tax=Candidatus Nitrososphaera gargensis TaxID=497727 RepID=K0ID62_NITGG|nr:hypothetical protein Ngar_c06570 [Candidatus Nitrososphaera gargensis Ga9.2]